MMSDAMKSLAGSRGQLVCEYHRLTGLMTLFIKEMGIFSSFALQLEGNTVLVTSSGFTLFTINIITSEKKTDIVFRDISVVNQL